MKQVFTIRVANKSNVGSVAGAIVKALDDKKDVEIITIGAGAVNQTVKAIITAQGILATKGLELVSKFGFATVNVADEQRTAIRVFLKVQG